MKTVDHAGHQMKTADHAGQMKIAGRPGHTVFDPAGIHTHRSVYLVGVELTVGDLSSYPVPDPLGSRDQNHLYTPSADPDGLAGGL